MKPSIVCVLGLLLGLVAISASAEVTTIYRIQLGDFAEGDEVTVQNVVVTASGRFGFFIQEILPDPTWQRMYSGIWVFTDGDHLGLVKRGDKVNVTGFYDEYYFFSEIDAANSPCGVSMDCSFEVVGTATVPDPVVMRIDEVNDSGPYNEAYESVLIRVDRDDATLFARQPDQFSEWYVSTDPVLGDTLLVDQYSADPEGEFDYTLPDEGDAFSFVQGILTYSYGKYKIAPRNCPEDLGTPCPPALRGLWAHDETRVDVLFAVDVDEASAENISHYSFDDVTLEVLSAARDDGNHRLVHLTTTAQTSGVVDIGYVTGVVSEGDLVVMPDGEFTYTQGITSIYDIQYTDDYLQDDSGYNEIVVTTTGRVSCVNGNYYFLQQGDAGPFKHLYGRVARTGELAEGDSVKVAGRVREYFGSTYLAFTPGVQYYENLGPATDPVVVTDVTADRIIYDCDTGDGMPPDDNRAEPWEDALLRLNEPAHIDSVDGQAALFGEWWVVNDPDTCRTDFLHEINDFGGTIFYRPTVADTLILTGILRYEYNAYRLIPRRRADIDVIYGGSVGEWLPGLSALALAPNRPNPFGRSTVFEFTLAADANAVSIGVYDVTGACVRHLLKGGGLRAGVHPVAWDGRDDRGHAVAAGSYFYRVDVDGRSAARRMLHLD